jgi:hypothetical protein
MTFNWEAIGAVGEVEVVRQYSSACFTWQCRFGAAAVPKNSHHHIDDEA